MKKSIFTIITILCALRMSGTTLVSAASNEMFAARVVHLDEFFARFNGTQIPGHIQHIADINESRLATLCQLFDLEGINGPDDPKAEPMLEMAHAIIKSGATIGYEKPGWYARATCRTSIDGKQSEIVLKLRPTQAGNDAMTWSIADAEGIPLEINAPEKSKHVFLDPSGHEANFMELRRITSENPQYITLYIVPGHEVATLDVFATLVYYGRLHIEAVTGLEFIFENIAGYTFTVSEFERDTYNSGWLISSFTKNEK